MSSRNKAALSKARYYENNKNKPAFKKRRAAWSKEYRRTHPKYRAYVAAYLKKYYKKNKKHLDEQTREPNKIWHKNDVKTLGKTYVSTLIMRTLGITRDQVTPYMLKKRRERVLETRKLRKKKQRLNESLENLY